MKESLTENIKTPKTLLETLGEYTSLSKDDQREKYNEYKNKYWNKFFYSLTFSGTISIFKKSLANFENFFGSPVVA